MTEQLDPDQLVGSAARAGLREPSDRNHPSRIGRSHGLDPATVGRVVSAIGSGHARLARKQEAPVDAGLAHEDLVVLGQLDRTDVRAETRERTTSQEGRRTGRDIHREVVRPGHGKAVDEDTSLAHRGRLGGPSPARTGGCAPPRCWKLLTLCTPKAGCGSQGGPPEPGKESVARNRLGGVLLDDPALVQGGVLADHCELGLAEADLALRSDLLCHRREAEPV